MEAKASTFHPADRISRCRPFRTEGSSSTIAITASDSGLGFFIMVLRKGKVKAGAWAVIGRSPQPAAMVLNNRTADGKSHAHATGLGGVERLKDLVDSVRVETYPRVFN